MVAFIEKWIVLFNHTSLFPFSYKGKGYKDFETFREAREYEGILVKHLLDNTDLHIHDVYDGGYVQKFFWYQESAGCYSPKYIFSLKYEDYNKIMNQIEGEEE